jgi:hypothetical protein
MPVMLEPMPPPPECPMCGYSRAGISGVPCPECGYVLTGEDLAHAYRWQMFLVFTRGTVWRRWILLVLAALGSLWFRDGARDVGPVMICGLACISLAAAWAGSRFMPTRGLRGRALRRCWMLAAAYAQLFWVVPLLAYVFPEMLGTYLFEGWYDDYSLPRLMVTLVLSGVLGAAVGLTTFRWIRVRVGLTLSVPERTSLSEGLRLALAPHLLVAVAAAIVGVVGVLDWLRPAWWWGT